MVKPFQYGRRSFIVAMTATLFALAGRFDEAKARLHGGIAYSGVGSASLITTLTASNTSGSSETPMWSKVFGLGFPDSDTTGCPLVGGQPSYPQFKVGSTVLGYSMSKAPTFHPSGRLRHATFCLLYGNSVTIANSGFVSIGVYQTTNTSRPANSGRSLSDFSAADLKHLVTGLDNVSGNYSATLNDGISDAFSDNYEWLDGAAGRMWRIRARYKQSGTAEGNLEAYVYCMAMQDNAGNFGGIRFQWCMSSPFGDASLSKRDWKSFSAMSLQTGATVIRDNVASGRTNQYNFTWTSGGNMNATSNVLEAGTLCRLTTTGTLPTGLNTGQSYWIGQATSNYAPPYNVFQLNTGVNFGGPTIPSGSGSGTHTVTVYPWLPCYGRLFMCGTNAEWDFVQGGGSFSPVSTYIDTNIQTKFDPAYWRSTMLLASYDFTPTLSAGTLTPFYINTVAGYSNFINAGGPSAWIGMLPNNFLKHLYNQTQTDETNVRITGLTSGQITSALRVLGNGATLPAWNRGTSGSGTQYSGMGTLLYDKRWVGYSDSTIYEVNSEIAGRSLLGIGPGDFSHQPAYTYYPYLITGLPEYLDMQMERCNTGLAGQYVAGISTSDIDASNYGPKGKATDGFTFGSRNVTTGATTRYLTILLASQGRQSAWGFRTLAECAAIVPQNHPECAAYRTYFNDVANDNIDFAEACAQTLWAFNSYAQNVGLWNLQVTGFWLDPWQNSFCQAAITYYYGLTGNSKALTLMNAYNRTVAHFINTFGVYSLGFFEVLCCSASSQSAGPIVTADTQLGNSTQGCLTWTTGSANFTLDVTATGGYVPQVGDIFTFPDGDLPSEAAYTPIPSAFSYYTPYYVKTVSGSGSTRTITLAATPGGTAIVNNDGSSFAHSVFCLAQTPITSIVTTNDGSGIPTQTARAALFSMSRGATFDAAAESLMMGAGGVPAATTGNFANQACYCFGKVA